jgi:glutamate--cysteine ligase
MLDAAALAADLRENAFGGRRHSHRPPTIGAEVELLPMDAATRRQVPIMADDGPSTLPFLRAFAERWRWRETASMYGMPNWVLPDGGTITFEPGGQIELSAPPFRSASALLQSLRATVRPLVAEAREHGIELLSVGVDPQNAVNDLPLQLPGKRYVRLTRFMEDCGTGGTRMMRQTASFQCNLDWSGDAPARWRFFNALSPYLTAIFANSPIYEGRDTGARSYRACVWRALDGGRTGIFACAADPVPEYLDFALNAPAILMPEERDGWLPFRDWNVRGQATSDDWKTHLTTLFPDVRPKGFVEVRSADAVAPEWYAAPVVFLGGLAYHEPSFAAARELVGAPDPALLDRAGRLGLRDSHIAATARDLFALALDAAAALGPAFLCPADVEEARAFYETYTARALSPADDALAELGGHDAADVRDGIDAAEQEATVAAD